MKLDIPLTSEHLLLRTLVASDVTEGYLAWLSDPDVNRYLEVRFAPPGTLAELAAFIEATNISDDSLLLGIFLRSNGHHIGNVKLGSINRHHRRADIGLLIGDKNEWGKGHASAAIGLVATYAFARLDIAKLIAGCYSGNEGSRRAFLNAGFVEEGRQVSQWIADGQRLDGLLLGRCKPAESSQVLAVLQARHSSSRLPGKVLLPVLGTPMLAMQIERLRRSRRIDALVVATSDQAEDDAVAALCTGLGVACFRGSLDDVLDRFYQSASQRHPATVVRLTGDCPLTDPEVIDNCIDFFREGNFDYASNAVEPSFPDGLDVEVMRFECLAEAWREARLPSEREHVTSFIHSHPKRFRIGHYRSDRDLSHLRWTVDEADDLEFVRAVYAALYHDNHGFATREILALLESRPDLAGLNASHQRNEGMEKSKQQDIEWLSEGGHRYTRSEALLDRALKTIPLGSQTFSKSKTQYPRGVSPYFIQRGQGSHVWDVDGNEYIDFINSLAAVTLGYNDPDVTAAVRNQLEEGVIFSLPHPVEMAVAERMVEMVPCAEMVRFGKNGSDATSGAIRLARAWTGRERVAVCGYHGWQDWYIGSTARWRGVPESVRALTHSFPYNDLDALDKLLTDQPGEFAAVIMEPMNTTEPLAGYLEGVKAAAHRHGALLVFDETITGFRYANGGAQQRFGVTPDLATFGKGLANGYPVSAVAGRADVMKLMEEIFFSFTFGGETLSLAAALATMTKLQREPVVDTLYRQGDKILAGVRGLIDRHAIGDFVNLTGNPTWSFLLLKDLEPYTQWQIKTLFMQEMLARGILTFGTHNISYSHSDADIAALLKAYGEVFPLLAVAVRERKLEAMLRCKSLEPLFKVR
jgi:glutamate-1-semialdehyde 2,1-aminomutase